MKILTAQFFSLMYVCLALFRAVMLRALTPVHNWYMRSWAFAMDTIPNVQTAAQYDVNRIGQAEGVRQSLYDSIIYPNAGQANIVLFQLPQGQGTSSSPSNSANAKGIWDTNMEAAGQLPSPKAFLVESIELFYLPGSATTAGGYVPQVVFAFAASVTQTTNIGAAVNDANLIMQQGELQFFIGSKSYLDEAPLMRFPPKVQFTLDASFASNSTSLGLVGAASFKNTGRPYYLNPPIFLTPTQNWKISLNFPSAQTTVSGFAGRIISVLDGFLYRNSQ